MSRLLARIMLALLMLPLAGLVYMATIVTSIELIFGYSAEVAPFLIATSISWVFIAVYWTLLWYGTVSWTQTRIYLTLAAVLAAIVPAAGAGLLIGQFEDGLGAFVGGVAAVLLWLTMTIFIWRETTAERAARVKNATNGLVCPTCGYNLTGLRQPACPECGGSWTLEELVALQPARDAVLRE